MEIRIERNPNPAPKPDWAHVGFGKYMTDHMFLMDYDAANGWHDARIVPYGPMPLDPCAVALHYAQETFEGLKAYRTPQGKIQLFRPEMNAKRMANSNRRLCMPEFPEDMFVEACRALVAIDADWVPDAPECSLYVRPFQFCLQPDISLHGCDRFLFAIILTPVGPYFAGGFAPVKILVEDEFVRAVRGGTGFAKCGGNYAGAMSAQAKADAMGYSQVLWLDGVERKYVEEAGGMNFMFLIDGEMWTAPLVGTVLPGVTRDSIIHMLKDWGVVVHEEYVAIDDVMAAIREGRLTEAFACGTAAVVAPVGALRYKDEEAVIGGFKAGALTEKIYRALTDIQWGRSADPYGWVCPVC